MNEQADRIIAFLSQAGAANIITVYGGKHPRIVFDWKGEQKFYVIPGSPSDSMRGYKSAISDLRHMLGLVKLEKRVGERRKSRPNKSAMALSECPSISAIPDWRDALFGRLSPRETGLLADLAWKQFWRECMAAVGGKSLL